MRRTALFISLLVALGSAPAHTQDAYDNGPSNGTTDAWSINLGFVVSDSFNLPSWYTVDGVNFTAWLYPGDVLQTADVSITSSEFGGTLYVSQTVSFTQSGCVSNQYGYSVCTESAWFNTATLGPGTYWLNLQNAVVNTGDPVYWDENSGPSSASENSIGTIPSESFTVLGYQGCGSGQASPACGPPPTTPEPATILLFAYGAVAMAGLLRWRT